MNIIISNSSGKPIYEQILEGLKGEISAGRLTEDTLLPSIRNLAKDLRISVITTKRAYEELEREGYIYTLPGKGSFVAKRGSELVREESLRKIEEHITEIYRLAAVLGLSEDDAIEMFKTMRDEKEV